MKRLVFFPLKAPHHLHSVHVLALDDGPEPRDHGITVWETDAEDTTGSVGASSRTPYLVGGSPGLVRAAAMLNAHLPELKALLADWLSDAPPDADFSNPYPQE